MIAAAGLQGFSQLVSGAAVYPQSRILFGCLCSGWYRSRFSRVVGLWSHIFHYWGDGLFVPAATWGFAFSFVGFARNLLRRLTRDWVVSLGG